MYVNGAALYATSAEKWDLTVSLHKMKRMRVNAEPGFVDGRFGM